MGWGDWQGLDTPEPTTLPEPTTVPEATTLPTGATLPVATSSNLLPYGSQAAHEAALGGSGGLGVPVKEPSLLDRFGEFLSDPKTLRAIAVGGLSLADAADRLTLHGQKNPRAKTRIEEMISEDMLRAKEARTAATEQERLGLEQQRVRIAQRGEARQVVEAQGKFIDTTIKNAPIIAAMGEGDARAAAIQAYREQAHSLGLDSSMIGDLFTKPAMAESVANYGPYLAHYGPSIWQQAATVKATHGDEAFFKFIEERAAPALKVSATNRLINVTNTLEQTKGAGKVTFDDVSTAMQAAAPLEWQHILAKQDEYDRYFTARGITTPGLAAKGAEAGVVKAAQVRAQDPFFDETKLLDLRKLQQDVQSGKVKAGFEGLPGEVQAELRADPDLKGAPTVPQVRAAIDRVDAALLKRSVEVSKQQGLAAAGLPARTPEADLKRVQDVALAQSQIGELIRLVPKVELGSLVGGIQPWANQVLQTGRVGPIPVPEALTGKLTTDQERFLALTQDYADSVLRMRSGAQINEQEMQRMLKFLTEPGLRPQTFVTRLQLQSELLGVRQEILGRSLKEGGYRAPTVTPPTITPPPHALSAAELKGLPDATLHPGAVFQNSKGARVRSVGGRWVPE